MRARARFDVDADTGGWVGEGGFLWGAIEQIRWAPGTPVDTGNNAVLTLTMLPNADDTGDGWTFATYTGLAADFVRVPRQPTHDASGSVDGDTGTPVSPAAIVATGDAIRVKVTGGPVGGRLYMWSSGR